MYVEMITLIEFSFKMCQKHFKLKPYLLHANSSLFVSGISLSVAENDMYLRDERSFNLAS